MRAEAGIQEEQISIGDEESALGAVLLRVRFLARRRLLWLAQGIRAPRSAAESRYFPGPAGAGGGRDAEIDVLINDRDDPAEERAWQLGQAELNARIAEVEDALSADRVSRLARLGRVFALDAFDRDLLHVCLASAVDPGMGRLYAFCHDHSDRDYPTLALTARLCGHGRFGAWTGSSPLRRWGMVAAVPGAFDGQDQLAALALDPAIRDWISGVDELDRLLVGRARLVQWFDPLPGWDVEKAADFVSEALRDDPARTVAIHVAAPPGSGRKTFSANVAGLLNMPLLAVDAERIPEEEWEETFIHAHRHAFLHGVALAWTGGWDSERRRRWPERIAHFPVQFILSDGRCATSVVPGAVELRIDLPAPGVAARRALWERCAPRAAAAFPSGVAELAERFNARPGAIAWAAGVPGASVEGMARALRDSRRGLLGGLAQRLECPFEKDDLIATDALHEALNDFVHEARDRALFWDNPEVRRLFPQGRGLTALFTGPPGTGKTMAAQVIAARLGLDLFRIDLSSVVSKYVGETSQNLQRILSGAAEMDVVLFFDEADALFSRRTEVKDAHDRFANTDTNHLLQALEDYEGIAILATNRKGNIDPAFIRRLRYALEFARPDASQRLQLWTRLIGALAGGDAAERLAPLIGRLATEIDVTGAQIKYAVLTGAFAARRDGSQMRADHLLRGLDREMAKEGRALNERERLRLS